VRLLIVEDNADLAELMESVLRRSGFATDRAATSGDASALLSSIQYAAVILDLGLPDGDGLGLLAEMRGREDVTPVLILTARSGLSDRVSGLRSGADDYLIKPFDHEELIARLEALLRRPGQILGKVLRIGNLALDTRARQASIGEQAEAFSAQDLSLLELLMRRSGRVVSKTYVEDQLFGAELEIGSNAVEVAIHRLRRKLERGGASAQICTARGIGYFITEKPA
jgi:DNA-binding response OmpR family regulator